MKFKAGDIIELNKGEHDLVVNVYDTYYIIISQFISRDGISRCITLNKKDMESYATLVTDVFREAYEI